jgi:hypothetical protein
MNPSLLTKTSFVLALTLACSVPGFAADKNGIAKIMVASPTTTYAGKKVSENDVITTVGALKSGAEGGAKVRLTGNEVVVELAANSEINLVIPPSGDPSDSIELVKGKVRVRVPKAKTAPKTDQGEEKSDKPRFLLRHRKVTMGVRGTDFYASANDDLDETELVVFDGQVEFANEKAPKETAMVKPGFWSGIGGRFGEKIHSPLKLSAAGLAYFEKRAHDTPSFTLQPVPTEKTPTAPQTSAPGH